MNVWVWIGIAFIVVGVSWIAAFAAFHFALRRSGLESVHYPCYRCGEVEATGEFMGLHYCLMCQIVVGQMYAGVRNDPPFGFPGAPGYLKFPSKVRPEQEKKEEAKP